MKKTSLLSSLSGGDLHAPVVVGRLYDEVVTPPQNNPGEMVLVLPGDEVATEKRLEMRINTPGDGTRVATLTLDGQVKIALTVDDEGVRVEVGETKLTLKQTNGSNGSIEISAGDAKITLQQGGDMTLETSGKLSIKGSTVEISGDTNVKIGGQTVDIN